jgi:MtN3 and saliva related transmembrane protein
MEFAPSLPTIVGLVAAGCTTGAFLPQVVRLWRLKSAAEISLATFLVYSIGTSLWLIYGLEIGSLPVIAANGATVVLSLTMVALKLVYDRAEGRPRN